MDTWPVGLLEPLPHPVPLLPDDDEYLPDLQQHCHSVYDDSGYDPTTPLPRQRPAHRKSRQHRKRLSKRFSKPRIGNVLGTRKQQTEGFRLGVLGSGLVTTSMIVCAFLLLSNRCQRVCGVASADGTKPKASRRWCERRVPPTSVGVVDRIAVNTYPTVDHHFHTRPCCPHWESTSHPRRRGNKQRRRRSWFQKNSGFVLVV